MHVRFLLGPAGSGKTFRCLTEARQALMDSAAGAPLVLVAPKQGTYQLEQQLLASPSLPGYTRLHILSFEGLARFILDRLQQAYPALLNEEGRLMVLRGLLAKKRTELRLFRASARLTGFAQQLSLVLREFQRRRLTPEALNQLAAQVQVESLSYKLQDLALLLREYLGWLKDHSLQDADCLLATATEALTTEGKTRETGGRSPKSQIQNPEPTFPANPQGHPLRVTPSRLHLDYLWVDGFADYSQQELDLLTALLPCCGEASVTFCLDRPPNQKRSWLSHWSVVQNAFESCQTRFVGLANVDLLMETLPRGAGKTRFLTSPLLLHLEKYWAEPQPYVLDSRTTSGGPTPLAPGPQASARTDPLLTPAPLASALPSEHEPSEDSVAVQNSLQMVICADPEAEAAFVAREILRYVRAGGRYREITVLVRKLEAYHQPVQRIFSRYEIPFFLDRRESVAHHPLAELARNALRTVTFGWQHEDWFSALKSGLVPADEKEIDRLENEALARGWKGDAWHQPIRIRDTPRTATEKESLERLEVRMEDLRQALFPPFQKLALALAACQNKPTGVQLAAAIHDLFDTLNVPRRLEDWEAAGPLNYDSHSRGSVHGTVWNQVNAWLDNLSLAFPTESLPLREWLPVLEAGLAGLTVGVIPPALDQVLIGAIDRSRTPDINLAFVLGLNETVFPAPPESPVLLTEADHLELAKRQLALGPTSREQLGRERYLAYIACTRARERLVLTCAARNAQGAPLNPSPFLAHVRRLVPSLRLQLAPKQFVWQESQHAGELIGTLLADPFALRASHSALMALPGVAPVLEQLRHFQNPELDEALAPELALQLYRPVLRTSVSRVEQFAACPFKFFVNSGLRAEERKLFELDVKEQGSFQHEILALFQEQLHAEQKRWRDITPAEARDRIARLAQGRLAIYRDGLLQASEQTQFMARVLIDSLQDFIETLVGWMREQYQFDPAAVELPFGSDDASPAWAIDLGSGHTMELHGRIDRVDLCPQPDGDALCVVVDYKSSQKQLDPVLMAHGLQLQLLSYLNVLRRWPNSPLLFGVVRLVPAGVFYVSLRGKYDRGHNRSETLADPGPARKRAYRHSGRFDSRALRQLDHRTNALEGDQFSYRLKQDGQLYKNSRDAMATADFMALLDSVEANLINIGRQIYSGVAAVTPYRKGGATACDQCGYQTICRIDPWTHSYRLLRSLDEKSAREL